MLGGLLDTNVLVVANGGDGCERECVNRCVDNINEFKNGRRILYLDSLRDILDEYQRNTKHYPQGVGDQFFIWAVTYQGVAKFCRTVEVNRDPHRGYSEFPDDPDLAGFDPSDRKFVAVAIASGDNPTIFNATDSDWSEHSIALSRHVVIEELCLRVET